MATLEEAAAQHSGIWVPAGAKSGIMTRTYVAAKIKRRECICNDDSQIVELNGEATVFPGEAPA